jgi:choline dehydrogenase-like flavoprotein
MAVDGQPVFETDVCVVGAGPAGITLARDLVGLDVRVCVLESGGRLPETDPDPVAHGDVVGAAYDQLDLTRLRGFGGNGQRWFLPVPGGFGLRLRPLDAIDFERREDVPYSGWPFDRRHLEPYYERASETFRIGSFDDFADRAEPAQEDRPRLALRDDRITSPTFRFARADWFVVDGRRALDNSPNVTTVLHANVCELELDESGQAVDTVRVVCDPGEVCMINAPGMSGDAPLHGVASMFRVRSKIFVLAAGGTATPQLLLASTRDRPRGVGNQHDLVGRFFMEHLHLWPGRLVPNERALFASTRRYEPHVLDGVQAMSKLALADAVLREERLLNYCVGLQPDPWSEGMHSLAHVVRSLRARRAPGAVGHHLRNVLNDRRDIARTLAGRMGRRARRSGSDQRREPAVYLLNSMSEQAPDPSSRVRLSNRRDVVGRPRIELDWRVGDLDLHTVDRAHEILDRELRRAGIGRLEIDRSASDIPEGERHGGWHHMGTTRMHRDPSRGVVDQNGRVHEVSNLYVTGSSVFPTCGYANPALTVVALAHRLADCLRAELQTRR